MVEPSARESSGSAALFGNSDGTLDHKSDARGQKVVYHYDPFQRVTGIDRYPAGAGSPDICQGVSLSWDFVGIDGVGWNNPYGNLGWATSGDPTCPGGQLTEAFDYNQAGQVTAKLVTIAKTINGQVTSGSVGGLFYYDTEGKPTDQYVDDPISADHRDYSRYVHYSYDQMSRPTGTTDNGDYKNYTHVYGPTVNVASNATYTSTPFNTTIRRTARPSQRRAATTASTSSPRSTCPRSWT